MFARQAPTAPIEDDRSKPIIERSTDENIKINIYSMTKEAIFEIISLLTAFPLCLTGITALGWLNFFIYFRLFLIRSWYLIILTPPLVEPAQSPIKSKIKNISGKNFAQLS